MKQLPLLALLWALLSSPAWARDFLPPVKEAVLPNGLKVLVAENHRVPKVSVQVWYKVGSKHEPPGQGGISHLLEHMMFRSSKLSQGKNTHVIDLLRDAGGDRNGYTERDYTYYVADVAPEELSNILTIEADRMRNLVLLPEELEKERQVVLEELRLDYDKPDFPVWEWMRAYSWVAHPYQNPAIGYPEVVAQLTLEQVQAYYDRWYHPDRATVVIVGDIETERAVAAVKQSFAAIPKGPQVSVPAHFEPASRGEIRIHYQAKVGSDRVLIRYPAPAAGHPDMASLEVLSKLIADNDDDLVAADVVGKQRLASWVHTYDVQMFGESNEFSAVLYPTDGTPLIKLLDAWDQAIETLHRSPPSQQQIDRVKSRLRSTLYWNIETTHGLAYRLGEADALGHFGDFLNFLNRVKAVTPDDVSRVMQQYLIPRSRTIVFVEAP